MGILQLGWKSHRHVRLQAASFQEADPSWSLEGRSIYFFSKRQPSGIWRISATGEGEPVKVAGRVLGKSPDGTWIYYSAEKDVWKEPVQGGDRVPLAELKGEAHQVVQGKIYFLMRGQEEGTSQPTIWSYDMQTEEVRQLAVFDKSFNWYFSISPDATSILYDKLEERSSDLMLVENFR